MYLDFLLHLADGQCGPCRPGAFAPSGASPTKVPLAKSASSKLWRMGSRKSRCAAAIPPSLPLQTVNPKQAA